MKYNDPAAQQLRDEAKANGLLPDKSKLGAAVDKVEEVAKAVVEKVEKVVKEAAEKVEDFIDGDDDTAAA